MEPNWAYQHLQTIRTLMERAAIYRRALAPIMILLGVIGILGATAGLTYVRSPQNFASYWMVIGVIAVSAAYLMARRQALKESDPFWSPPTRRVTQAALPALFAGVVAGLLVMMLRPDTKNSMVYWLPSIWMVFYGCAIHAAGFFMPRGIKLFGWIFILSGSLTGAWILSSISISIETAHLLMGGSFGGLQSVYGIYLFFTERTKSAV